MADVTADRILADLHKLWAGLAAPDSAPVLRASALTLIVVAEEAEKPAGIAGTLAEVMREHPNRAVIVRVGAAGALGYHVNALCWMPFGTRQQICCEQVEIAAPEAGLAGLVPVLLAITAPDLPLVVWCRSTRLFRLPALAPLFGRAGKVVADAPLAELQQALARGWRVADLSWARITRWREIVAQIFEDPARRAVLSPLRRVTVFYAGDAPPVTAYYLAGWVMSCADCGDIETRLEAVPPVRGGIEGLVLESDSRRVSIRRAEGDSVLIEADGLLSCALAPRLPEPELLIAELGIAGRDTVFERSLERAARLAQR
ncbi:MAG: glucose-6-phosphate dehydrogenase assembly protein OpcA [Acidobacteriota bacterium]